MLSGFVADTGSTFVVMGFDPDRAALITALVVGSVAAALGALLTSSLGAGSVAALVGLGLLFGPTFVRETTDALASTGGAGSFDAGGWALTVLTLVTSGVVAGFAAAAVALTVRPHLAEALAPLGELLSKREPRPALLRRPAMLLAVVAVLAVTSSALGDLLNYAPDSLMLHGGPPHLALSQGDVGGGPVPSPVGGSPGTTIGPSGDSPVPSASPSPGSSPLAASPSPTARPVVVRRPWLAWRPSGSGRVVLYQLPAPWTGGVPTDDIGVYLPPGYDSSGGRRYPVLYEAPTPYGFWDGATDAKAVLDGLIDSGAIPASVVVFIDSGSGPYPDSECADSFDGREWMDRYVANTVVPWVDAHVRTIAEPAARAIFGMSQGGYCAAILALHHPAVFASEISFSGYYQAGAGSVNAGAVFGGLPALLSADSPLVVASQLPLAMRRIGFVLVADPAQAFYGPQQSAFVRVLQRDGYPVDPLWPSILHGWQQVRAEFAPAIELVAQREVALGVFG